MSLLKSPATLCNSLCRGADPFFPGFPRLVFPLFAKIDKNEFCLIRYTLRF